MSLAALQDLFIDIFVRTDELGMFLIRQDSGLGPSLPSDRLPLADFVFRSLELLRARGYLDAELFRNLMIAYPRRRAQIHGVALQFIGQAAADQARAEAEKHGVSAPQPLPPPDPPAPRSVAQPERVDTFEPPLAAESNFVVFTALSLEARAMLALLSNVDEYVLQRTGTIVDRGELARESGNIRVAVVECGVGNQTATALAMDVIQDLDPRAIFFVGVAGALKDLSRGDVVVATKVYGYESGKAEAEFKPRPDVGTSTHRLLERAKAEARRERWIRRISPAPATQPRAITGPIAAGEQVVADTRSETYQFLRRQYSDAVAVEMEGRGFLTAAWVHHVDAVVVRGISDCIDGKAEADSKGFQEIAAAHAAAFTAEMIVNLAPAGLQPAPRPPKPTPRPGGQQMTSTSPSPPPPSPASSFTVLFLTAQPGDTAALDVGREVGEIRAYLAKLGASDRLKIEIVPDAQIKDLIAHISSFKPKILHIHMHGRESDGALLFVGPGSTAHPVLPAQLVELLAPFKDLLDLVVLQACFSEGLARRLGDVGIPAVGVSRRLAPGNAALFASNLYGGIVDGRLIGEASSIATMVLQVSGVAEAELPRLFKTALTSSRRAWSHEPTRSPSPALAPESAYTASAPPLIVILCAPADQRWVDQLRLMFSFLPEGALQLWDATEVPFGHIPERVVEAQLATAAAVILLLSPSFTADRGQVKRLPRLLEGVDSGRIKLFWLPVRPCHAPQDLGSRRPVLGNSEALSTLPEAQVEAVLKYVTADILVALDISLH